jgi:hypothetical protein
VSIANKARKSFYKFFRSGRVGKIYKKIFGCMWHIENSMFWGWLWSTKLCVVCLEICGKQTDLWCTKKWFHFFINFLNHRRSIIFVSSVNVVFNVIFVTWFGSCWSEVLHSCYRRTYVDVGSTRYQHIILFLLLTSHGIASKTLGKTSVFERWCPCWPHGTTTTQWSCADSKR